MIFHVVLMFYSCLSKQKDLYCLWKYIRTGKAEFEQSGKESSEYLNNIVEGILV